MTAVVVPSEPPKDVKTSVVLGLKSKLDKLLTSSRSDSSRQLVLSLQKLRDANNVDEAWDKIKKYIDDKSNSHRTLYKEIQILLSRANKKHAREQKIDVIVGREIGGIMPDITWEEKKGFADYVKTELGRLGWQGTQFQSKASRELKKDIFSKNSEETFDKIVRYLCVSKNKRLNLHFKLMSMLDSYRSKMVDQYMAEGKYDQAIEKLRMGIIRDKEQYRNQSGKYAKLGECYEAKGEIIGAFQSYITAYSKSSIRSSKYLNKKATDRLLDLVKSTKDLSELKKMYSENHGGRTSQLVSRSIKNIFLKSSSPGGIVAQVYGFGLPSLGIAATGLVRGLFHAATRKSPSKVEMEGLIDNLHHFAADMTADEKEAVIKTIVENYGSKKSNLATSDSSKVLCSRLINQETPTNEKVDAILAYMLAFNANKVLHNKGKRLFNVIAKACSQSPSVKNEKSSLR